jgi:hypothetical protein
MCLACIWRRICDELRRGDLRKFIWCCRVRVGANSTISVDCASLSIADIALNSGHAVLPSLVRRAGPGLLGLNLILSVGASKNPRCLSHICYCF